MGSPWQVSQELHEVNVKTRAKDASGKTLKDEKGNAVLIEGTVYIRELSEGDTRRKNASLVSYNRKGDAQSARVNIQNLRKYEMEQSVVDWTFTADGEEMEEDFSNKLPVNPMTIANLPEAVSDQIHQGITDLNGLPQDEEDEDGEVEENPISATSDETSEYTSV